MSRHHTNSRNMQRQKKLFRDGCEATNEVCWLCGMPIDYEAPHDDYDNDDRFELDHYYPASTHPEHYEDPANFRASHAGCNRERSNNAPRPGLGILSRDWI